MKITGISEAIAKLGKLGDQKTVKSLLKKSLRAGAKPMLLAARAKAPVRTGRVKKALRIAAATKQKPGWVGVVIKIGDRNFVGIAFYGAFQEFGWHVGSRRLGSARREIPGKHFLEQAFDEESSFAADATGDDLIRRIEEMMK